MRTLLVTLAFVSVSRLAQGGVQEFTNRQAWFDAAGSITTIGFADLPNDTLVTTQYAELGATFTDGVDLVLYNEGFLNDGVGLNGAFDQIAIEFAQPMQAIGVDFPGGIQLTLVYHGVPFYTSTGFVGPGEGAFGGIISSNPFDGVLIIDPRGDVFIDDLHFGPPIPAPPAIALIVLPFMCPCRRRRG